MYIGFIFICYIFEMFISLAGVAFISLVLVKKEFRNNRVYKAARNFSVIVFLTGLLYFGFYCFETIYHLTDTVVFYRFADYTLYGLVFMFWMLLLRELIGKDKKDNKLYREILCVSVSITAIDIGFPVAVSILFMDGNYNINNHTVLIIWIVFQSVFFFAVCVILLRYARYGIRLCVKSLHRRYILLCTVAIFLFELIGVLYEICQSSHMMTLDESNFLVSALDVYFPDLTGLIMAVLSILTLVFTFKEDFSAIFFTDIDSGEVNAVDAVALKYNLTVREREVFVLLYENYSNAEIADELCISINTVKRHVRNIYEKLETNSRADIIHLVIEQNHPMG